MRTLRFAFLLLTRLIRWRVPGVVGSECGSTEGEDQICGCDPA